MIDLKEGKISLLYQMYITLHCFLKGRLMLTRFIIGSLFLFLVQLLICIPSAIIQTLKGSSSFFIIFVNEYFYRFGSGLARIIDFIPGNTVYAILLSIPILLLIWSVTLKDKLLILAFILAGLLVLWPIDYKLLATYF